MTEEKRFIRGDVEYRRSCGWKRYTIKVVGRYEDEVWLGSNNSPQRVAGIIPWNGT